MLRQNQVRVIPQSHASIAQESNMSKLPENSSFGYASEVPSLNNQNNVTPMRRIGSKLNQEYNIKAIEEEKRSSKVKFDL